MSFITPSPVIMGRYMDKELIDKLRTAQLQGFQQGYNEAMQTAPLLNGTDIIKGPLESSTPMVSVEDFIEAFTLGYQLLVSVTTTYASESTLVLNLWKDEEIVWNHGLRYDISGETGDYVFVINFLFTKTGYLRIFYHDSTTNQYLQYDTEYDKTKSYYLTQTGSNHNAIITQFISKST